MSAAAIIAAGFAAVAGALTLARMEHALAGARGRVGDPLGDALAVFVAWMAFAGLAAAGTYRLGLVATLALVALTLGVGRLLPARAGFAAAFGWKLPLAVAALAAAILGILGVMSIIEGSEP